MFFRIDASKAHDRDNLSPLDQAQLNPVDRGRQFDAESLVRLEPVEHKEIMRSKSMLLQRGHVTL
jgi:hypothetical protein